jgi:hypothetical protein
MTARQLLFLAALFAAAPALVYAQARKPAPPVK